MTFTDKLLLEIGWPGSQDTRGGGRVGPPQTIGRSQPPVTSFFCQILV